MYYAGWNCMFWPIFRVCAFYLNMHVKTPTVWHAEREIQIFQMLIMGWFLKFCFFSVRKYLWNNLRKFWNARDQDSRLEDDDKRIIFLMRSNILHNTSECRLAPWGGPNRDWKMVISNFSKPTKPWPKKRNMKHIHVESWESHDEIKKKKISTDVRENWQTSKDGPDNIKAIYSLYWCWWRIMYCQYHIGGGLCWLQLWGRKINTTLKIKGFNDAYQSISNDWLIQLHGMRERNELVWSCRLLERQSYWKNDRFLGINWISRE